MSKALVKKPKTTVAPLHVVKDRVVQRLSEAEKALAFAVTIDQVKLVMDVSAAQEVFAKRQKLGEDVIGFAHTLKMRALAKLGELLKTLEKNKGVVARTKKGLTRGSSGEPRVDAPATLKELGISKKVSHVAQQLADLPASTREAIAQRETTLAKAKREQTVVEIRTRVSLPDAKYRVLYADPPWQYSDKADAGSVQGKGAAHHYPTMSIQDLCALDAGALAEPDAVLFLWVTSPLLFEAAPVIKAWGFTYKASFVWDKVAHNMGHYNSVRHEFLLVCTRGSAVPDVTTKYDSVQVLKKTPEHSRKPEEFRAIIDALYPHGKRIELFARGPVPKGWAAYGFEATAAS